MKLRQLFEKQNLLGLFLSVALLACGGGASDGTTDTPEADADEVENLSLSLTLNKADLPDSGEGINANLLRGLAVADQIDVFSQLSQNNEKVGNLVECTESEDNYLCNYSTPAGNYDAEYVFYLKNAAGGDALLAALSPDIGQNVSQLTIDVDETRTLLFSTSLAITLDADNNTKTFTRDEIITSDDTSVNEDNVRTSYSNRVEELPEENVEVVEEEEEEEVEEEEEEVVVEQEEQEEVAEEEEEEVQLTVFEKVNDYFTNGTCGGAGNCHGTRAGQESPINQPWLIPDNGTSFIYHSIGIDSFNHGGDGVKNLDLADAALDWNNAGDLAQLNSSILFKMLYTTRAEMQNDHNNFGTLMPRGRADGESINAEVIQDLKDFLTAFADSCGNGEINTEVGEECDFANPDQAGFCKVENCQCDRENANVADCLALTAN